MANIMSPGQFRNKPSRDGFDLSSKRNFTAKVGELLPVWHKPVLPGDSFTIDLRTFTRTMPLNTAAYARMREYYDFYFVPLEQLWNKAPEVLTQMLSNAQHSTGLYQSDNVSYSGDMPYFTCADVAQLFEYARGSSVTSPNSNDIFGRADSENMCKLLQYLGYGNFYNYGGYSASIPHYTWSATPLTTNLELNPFPLLAYQKIYNDHFRFQQWETSQPWTFNLDYIKGTNDCRILNGVDKTKFFQSPHFFTLRYANYQRDLFRGVLPQPQYGDTAIVELSSGTALNLFSGASLQGEDSSVGFYAPNWDIDTPNNNGYLTTDPPAGAPIRFANAPNISILALRQAEFLQKWKEIAQSADEDYKAQIQAHWNVSVSDYLSGMSRYLGGTASSLDINEVTNTNLTEVPNSESGENYGANLAGKGIISGNGQIRFTSNGEYGIIMCLYHCEPILDYVTSSVDPYCTCVTSSDYPIPEFDKIGMEQVPIEYLSNPTSNVVLPKDKTLGYAPRYVAWKTDVDKSVGAFATTLQPWVLPMTDELVFAQSLKSTEMPETPGASKLSISSRWFKVNPSIVDQLFAYNVDATIDSDHLLCSTYFDCKVARNLDRDGLPY